MIDAFILFAFIGVFFVFQQALKDSFRYLVRKNGPVEKRTVNPLSIPLVWRKYLLHNISFYKRLTPDERIDFEERLLVFLGGVNIDGVGTKIKSKDRLLIAASAIIPVFRFPHWRYNNLHTILLYPDQFTLPHDPNGATYLGAVGNSYMNGKVLLSRKALYDGFKIAHDSHNTGVHEFLHIIDKQDGVIDGIPKVLLNEPNVLPWLNFMQQKIDEINRGVSNLDAYAAKNNAEFFAITSEYFFEKPETLAKDHPKLHAALSKMFGTSN